ncbi:MAG: glycosyltransferase family 2 protein [Gemmatimonadetes bacterium]|jgi:polyisoprenyl-phosphate glycosyltransferase|nr:glycosyltransferase family 2 protein [Gemmatimonadota bacterium]
MPDSVELSIVIPAYHSGDVIGTTVEEIISCVDPWCPEYEIIIVNDGSRDDTYDVIRELARNSPRIRAVNLAKNFGQHNASLAGLSEAAGERIVILDDDGQHDPACIQSMCAELAQGADVVYVRYETKIDPLHKNLGSWLNDRMSVRLLGKPTDLYLSSFKAMTQAMRDECIRFQGPFVYLDGILLRATHHIAIVPATHRPTIKSEKSTYSLRKLFALWLNMFTSFSIAPLRTIFLVGSAIGLAAVTVIVAMIALYIIDPSYGGPRGWTTVFVMIVLFGGLQLLAIGVIGEYVGRILLIVNRSPQHVVKERE